MQNRRGGWILIVLLFIVIFIVGVRYGQRVEKANEAVNFLLSIPPSKTPPTLKPDEYRVYSHKDCGVRFINPSSLTVQKESSIGARLGKNGVTSLIFSCEAKNPFLDELKGDKIATEEIQFQNRAYRVRTKSGEGQKFFFLDLRNTVNRKALWVQVEQRLLPLFEQTLKFQ